MKYKYTITMPNYNMANTISQALDSVLEQINSDFEVLVVDDGSTDDSVSTVKKKKKNHPHLKLITLPQEEKRTLGEVFNKPIQEAKGEYVLHNFDADDKYDNCILDFVYIYHQLEKNIDYPFYLNGNCVNMAKKELLLKYGPFRKVGRAQDKDFWRRLIHNNELIWLDHSSFCEEIGYKRTLWGDIKNKYKIMLTEFSTGVTLSSSYKCLFEHKPRRRLILWPMFVFLPFAYLHAKLFREQFELPPETKKRSFIFDWIEANKKTLSELENQYDFKIDKNKLSKKGKKIFYGG